MITPNLIFAENGKRTISRDAFFDHSLTITITITPEIRSHSCEVFYLAGEQVERNFATMNCCKSKKLQSGLEQ